MGGTHRGNFYNPTVLAGVTKDMREFSEGYSLLPITSVIRAEDHENALAIANDTSYGLASAVITNDVRGTGR